jgi:branched-chain amino acid transport system substrate-binding protein
MKNKMRGVCRCSTRRALLGAASAAAALPLSPKGLVSPAVAQAKPIRIGVLAPLSGVYASLGTNKVDGIRMLLGEPAANSHAR